MKRFGLLFFTAVFFAACTEKKIEKVVVVYTNKGVYDSTEFRKPAELAVFENFVNNKVKVTDKFSTQYYLTIHYHDGKTAEYFGNGAYIKNQAVYTVADPALQKRFVTLVYSGLLNSLKNQD